MEHRRIETAPAWLLALAGCALGMSWAVTRDWNLSTARPPIDQPARTSAPLRWPIAELEPIAAPVLAFDEPSFTAPSLSFEITPPAASLPTLSGPTEADLLAIQPLELPVRAELLVVLPEPPRWRHGEAGVRVLSAKTRRRWAIAGVDTFAGAWRLGRLLADPLARADAGAAWSRVASASAWLRGHLPSQAESTPTPPRMAAIGPRLATPEVRDYTVIPVEQPMLPPADPPTSRVSIDEPTVAEAEQPTIAGYLAEAGDGAFPVAAVLAEQLDRVAQTQELAPWAWDVAYRLRRLAESRADAPSAAAALRALERQTGEAFTTADESLDAAAATELRRAAYGLTRRTNAWRAEQTQTLVMLERRRSLDDPLTDVRWAMASPSYGYSYGSTLADSSPRWDVLRVAQRLELYEQAPTSRLARSLAESVQELAASGEESSTDLARAIETNYRNANVRVAIAAELVERLLPQPEPITSAVRDRIAGAPVSGQSTTESELAVRLTPDAASWRIGLEARGVVASRTYSRGGPAVIGSRGTTDFVAKKLVLLTPDGLRAAPAIATAQPRTQQLVSLRTSYDRVPVVGNLVRSAARDEYGRLRGRAQAETRVKVERQVSETFDQQVTPQLVRVEQRFADEVTGRLAALGLRVEPIELRTTQERLIGRVRIAGAEQLAAHTPRMRAPSDSLLSVQLHESSLNNVLEGLDLAGERVSTDELRTRLAERLRLPAREAMSREKATLKFAVEDPIRFRLNDGQAELVLALDELTVRGARHRNFKVHTFYRPEVNGLTAELVQVGTPHIEGRLRTASRIHLHGVMGKVLGESERIPLVRVNNDTPERMAAALVGLATNQFVIEDGWLGLAIGPQRPAKRLALQVGGYVR